MAWLETFDGDSYLNSDNVDLIVWQSDRLHAYYRMGDGTSNNVAITGKSVPHVQDAMNKILGRGNHENQERED